MSLLLVYLPLGCWGRASEVRLESDCTRGFFVRVQSRGGLLKGWMRSPEESPLPGTGGSLKRRAGPGGGSMAAEDCSPLLTGCLASNYTASELRTKLAATFSVKGAREIAAFSRTPGRGRRQREKRRGWPSKGSKPLLGHPWPLLPRWLLG